METPLNRIAGYFNKTWEYLAEEKNKGYTLGGGFASGVYAAHIFTFSKAFWATFVSGLGGLVYIGLGAIVTKVCSDLWSDKIKHKIKYFKNGKDKKDNNERRA
jgi:hypothetical protein